MALPFSLLAQTNYTDTIITVLGDTIPCQLKMITPNVVSYSSLDGDKLMEVKNIKSKIINGRPQIVGDDNKPVNPQGISEIKLAGIDLQKASKTWYSGFVITLVGGILTGTGAALINKAPSAANGLLIGGGIASFFGGITMVASFSKIGSAGQHLDAYKPDHK